MRIRKQQSGFVAAELVLIVVILVAVVLAGWWVYQNQHKTTTPTTAATTPTNSTQSPVANNVSKAPEVHSTSDLDKALSTLNQNDPAGTNSSDSSQLDSQTNF